MMRSHHLHSVLITALITALINVITAAAVNLALSGVVTTHAQHIGRLFSTPAERVALDRLRQQGFPKTIAPTPDIMPSEAASEPAREQWRFDGFVKRSSGKDTIWINQTPHNNYPPTEGIRVRQQLSHPPAVSLQSASGKRVQIKPGQTFDKTSGKVREVYEPAPVIAAPASGAAEQ